MDNITIQKITIDDLVRLQKVGRQTFFETFSPNNTPENISKYLNEGFSESQLTKELTNPNSEFYFAIFEGAAIGYLKINFGTSQTELQDDQAIEIERIYILNEFQGKRVGQLLYNKAVDIARERKVQYLWLGVWEENTKAIDFYKKNGFVAFDKHIFKLGDDEQTDIMMKLML